MKSRLSVILLLSLFSIPLTLKAEYVGPENKVLEWIDAHINAGDFVGVSDAKDGIRRHIEAVLSAIDAYAQSKSTYYYTESEDVLEHLSHETAKCNGDFSYEIVDILLEGSAELVAIRVQEGFDCNIKRIEDTRQWESESSHIVSNRALELSSIDSLDTSVNKMYAKMYQYETDTTSQLQIKLRIETTEESCKKLLTHVPGDRDIDDETLEINFDHEAFKEAFEKRLKRFFKNLE